MCIYTHNNIALYIASYMFTTSRKSCNFCKYVFSLSQISCQQHELNTITMILIAIIHIIQTYQSYPGPFISITELTWYTKLKWPQLLTSIAIICSPVILSTKCPVFLNQLNSRSLHTFLHGMCWLAHLRVYIGDASSLTNPAGKNPTYKWYICMHIIHQ